MKLYLHEATAGAPGEKHGVRGPTHAGTVDVDYEYQVEEWIKEIGDYETIVRIECPELGREWKRNADGKFAESGGEERK